MIHLDVAAYLNIVAQCPGPMCPKPSRSVARDALEAADIVLSCALTKYRYGLNIGFQMQMDGFGFEIKFWGHFP